MPSYTTSRTTNQTVALGLGVVYLLVGLVGFAVTGTGGFAHEEGDKLLGIFELNPLHNIVHLGVGAALLAASARPVGARAVNGVIGSVYLLVGVVGPFLDGDANILALNGADHLLHLGSAALLLGVALRRDPSTSRSAVTVGRA